MSVPVVGVEGDDDAVLACSADVKAPRFWDLDNLWWVVLIVKFNITDVIRGSVKILCAFHSLRGTIQQVQGFWPTPYRYKEWRSIVNTHWIYQSTTWFCIYYFLSSFVFYSSLSSTSLKQRSQGPRDGQTNLGQPIVVVLLDGVPPGGMGCQAPRALVGMSCVSCSKEDSPCDMSYVSRSLPRVYMTFSCANRW